MKKLLLAIFLLALSLSSCSQKPGNPGYLLVKKGFKIFKLGDSIEKYDNIRFDHDEEGSYVKVYEVIKNSSDPSLFKVGRIIELGYIKLVVYKGRIMGIRVTVKEPYKKAFFDLLQADYGEPDKKQDQADIEIYTWNASNMKNKVRLLYAYSFTSRKLEKGLAYFYDVNINEELSKDQKNMYKENIKDL